MEPQMSQLLQQLGSVPPELLEQLTKELPPELLETLGPRLPKPSSEHSTSSVGTRDLRKKAEAEAPAIYAQVLSRYCHPDVVRQYHTLQEEEQEKLLKALRITVEENFLQISQQMMMEEQLSKKTRTKNSARDVGDSLLVRALRLVNQAEVLEPEAVQIVEQSLRNWGIKLPGHIHVMQHMRGYEDHLLKFKDDGNEFRTLSTNSTLSKPESATGQARTWHQLQPIGISALRLFGVATGKVLVGKLVVPPMVTVGITTLLQDQQGEVVQLGLYNQLPGGVTGHQAQQLAEKQFAKGATLEIAEPFLKIFRAGTQGIRVDSPHDIRKHDASTSGPDLHACRQSGNDLYKMEQFEAALSEYWRGLRTCDELAVLLSNRAQAELRQGDAWGAALRDSAASLLLCPKGAKHRARYVLALENLGVPALAQRAKRTFASEEGSSQSLDPLDVSLQETQAVLRRALKMAKADGRGNESESSESYGSLKEKGNMAFREGRYSEAVEWYTKSVGCHPATEEAANLLRNVALSSIRAGLLHDAVAAAAASLRLQFHPKTIYHLAHALALLGELQLSHEVLSDTEVAEAALTQLAQEVARIKEYVRLKYPAEIVAAAASTFRWSGKFIVDWVSEAIVTERIEGKGRGVRSLRNIGFGETLILQRPRGCVTTDAEAEKELLTSTDTSSGLIDDASKVKLTSQLTSMASKDQVLAKVLFDLEDGTKVEKPLRSLPSFLDGLQASVLPFLLQQTDFFPAAERLELSSARIRGVVSVNTHGHSKENIGKFRSHNVGDGMETKFSKLSGGSTGLYPAVSMINHSNNPNCVLLPFFHDEGKCQGMAVSAMRSISKGEELTLAYLDNPEAVKAKWGITD